MRRGAVSNGVRIRTAVLVAALAAVAAACTAPAPRGAFDVATAPCADITLVTARGSSSAVANAETRSVWRRFREAAAALAPGRTLRIVEIGDLDGNGVVDPGGYPAYGVDRVPGIDLAAAPDDIWVIGGYNESRRVGAEETAAVLARLGAACPATRFVVVGTSMGADAVGSGLLAVPPEVRDRIDAVELFGDPRLVVGPWLRDTGAELPSGHGLLGARTPYVPDDLVARTTSWCGRFDGTCTAQWWLSIFQLIPQCPQLRQVDICAYRHVDYDYWAHEGALREAVAAVMSRSGA
ncbi:MAG: cutinase family protein [Microthrixaceae bacterium]